MLLLLAGYALLLLWRRPMLLRHATAATVNIITTLMLRYYGCGVDIDAAIDY